MKYKYKILILDINKDNLHEELNKYGAGGYKVIDIRDLPIDMDDYGLRREYTLIKEYQDKKYKWKPSKVSTIT